MLQIQLQNHQKYKISKWKCKVALLSRDVKLELPERSQVIHLIWTFCFFASCKSNATHPQELNRLPVYNERKRNERAKIPQGESRSWFGGGLCEGRN
jgi:hypothetical protein